MDEPNATAPDTSNDDRGLIRMVGRALWRAELAPGTSVEDRKSSWSEHQAKYRQQARKLVRLLEGEGVELSASEAPDNAAED